MTVLTCPGRYELEGFERRYQLLPCWFHGHAVPSQALRRKLQERLGSPYWQAQLGRRIGALIKQQRVEVVHQQWPINVPMEPTIWHAMGTSARRKLALVYTAHEVFPHESRPGEPDGGRQAYREL